MPKELKLGVTFVQNSDMRKPLFFLGMVLALSGMVACNDGCVTCSGISAPQEICKDDFIRASDYQNYVNEYEENGGTCED